MAIYLCTYILIDISDEVTFCVCRHWLYGDKVLLQKVKGMKIHFF